MPEPTAAARVNGAGWNAIIGATVATFTLTAALAGQSVRVAVNYTDGGGTFESVVSAATGGQLHVGHNGALMRWNAGVDRLEGLAGNDGYTVNDGDGRRTQAREQR